jgi:pyruvate,water dikinase
VTFLLHPTDVPTIPLRERAALLGGKAAALAALHTAPVNIPPWVVLTPGAFYLSLHHEQRAALHRACYPEDAQAILEELHVSPLVQAEIAAALPALAPAGELLAVRSSATLEDGTRASFAGQFESFLNVAPTVEQVVQQIVQVWRSAFSARVLAYMREHVTADSEQQFPVPAVLIQRMVPAAAAGVAFSADPVSGRRGCAVVAAVHGLGVELVAGACDSDEYQVDRAGELTLSRPAGATPVLTAAQVQAVAGLARQTARLLGRPQDIEWAIAGETAYLLQARPITTLAEMADPDGALALWDNSNISESYNGVTTPLTFSFARRAYEEVYRQFCRTVGVPAASISAHSDTFRHMIGLLRGRIYYNLLNWYRLIALLPGYTFNRRFMEQMMGVREPLPAELAAEIGQPTTAAPWHVRARDGLALLGSGVRLAWAFATLPRRIQQFQQRLTAALGSSPPDLAAMRADELVAYYRRLESELLTRWDAPIINDFCTMVFYGLLRALTAAWCPDTDDNLHNDLLCGEGGMISAEPARRIQAMAQVAARHPALVKALRDGTPTAAQQAIARVPEFAQLYGAYLERFGERCLEELKLESPTLHDDPHVLLRMVGQIAAQLALAAPAAASDAAAAEQTQKQTQNVRQRAEARVQAALRNRPLRRLLFGWVLRQARAGVRERENLRFERTRVFGRARQIFLELGRRFAALELLDDAHDIFYLEVNEVLGFATGTATCTNLRGLAALRKQECARYRTTAAPAERCETRGLVNQGHTFQQVQGATPAEAADEHAQDEHQGTGCCPGVVRGRVRVVRDPRQATLQPGEILVAERTDPGWVMLFPAAAGLLVERGSLLSHSAIVARELGIPAIVALGGLTDWLRDGDEVELDGSRGTVRRLEAAVGKRDVLARDSWSQLHDVAA